jgi:hypothetical protein
LKTDKKKKPTVEIEIAVLRRIAKYYQFPMAVFFAQEKNIPKGTRQNDLLEKVKEFEKKMKELVEEF